MVLTMGSTVFFKNFRGVGIMRGTVACKLIAAHEKLVNVKLQTGAVLHSALAILCQSACSVASNSAHAYRVGLMRPLSPCLIGFGFAILVF